MKTLIITLHADPTIAPGAREGGGTHMYVNELINLMILKQTDTLFITRKASPGNELFEYGSVKLRRINLGPEGPWDKGNLDNLEIEIQSILLSELDSQQFYPDLIHSIYWHSGRAALYLSQKFSVPFIHTIISNGIKKQLSGFSIPANRIETEKKIYESAEIIISISNQEKDELIKHYNIPENKIKVIGRGVDNIFLKDIYDSDGTLNAMTTPQIKLSDESF